MHQRNYLISQMFQNALFLFCYILSVQKWLANYVISQ